jgi:cysteine-rich repeat protein
MRARLLFGSAIVLNALTASCGDLEIVTSAATAAAGRARGGRGRRGRGQRGRGGRGLRAAAAGGSGGSDLRKAAARAAAPGPACGDGTIDPGEACDDGNGDSGDGCTATCDAIERGRVPDPGEACVSTVRLRRREDHGRRDVRRRQRDPGRRLRRELPRARARLGLPRRGRRLRGRACGDSLIVAATRECDDGGASPGDGCDATLPARAGVQVRRPGRPASPRLRRRRSRGQRAVRRRRQRHGRRLHALLREASPTARRARAPSCGDGIKLPGGTEECEDGNTAPGDGCSETAPSSPATLCPDVGRRPDRAGPAHRAARLSSVATPTWRTSSASRLGHRRPDARRSTESPSTPTPAAPRPRPADRPTSTSGTATSQASTSRSCRRITLGQAADGRVPVQRRPPSSP